jgi:RNA polymerase sigma-70 factor
MRGTPPTEGSPGGAIRGTRLDGAAATHLHARAGAGRWGVSVNGFHEALERILVRRFGDGAAPAEAVLAFAEGLHLEDLALARGCAEGKDAAWEAFVGGQWRDVCRAARAIAGETDGEEIADALLADLFARGAGDGASRRPLFDYFHGRSKLSTWLRALVAQRHIDRIRATRRLAPLDEAAADSRPAPEGDAPDPDRARVLATFHQALDAALTALPVRDRLRLAYYHTDELTLAAIGRLLGEHEATVSRKLQKTRDQLKAAIDAALTAELKLGAEEVRHCYEAAIRAGGLDPARLRVVSPVTGAGAPSGP